MLGRMIRERFPRAAISTDPPVNSRGVWFIDIKLRDTRLCVQWRRDRGFGISPHAASAGYGERPAAVFDNEHDAFDRVVSLFGAKMTRTFRSSPDAATLS
jgi:hypothetical protein